MATKRRFSKKASLFESSKNNTNVKKNCMLEKSSHTHIHTPGAESNKLA
jgi:hypothetical protein